MAYYKGKVNVKTARLYSYDTLTTPVETYDTTAETAEVDFNFPKFSDVIKDMQSETYYYNVISIGGVRVSDYPTYYTDQYKPGEQPIIFDNLTRMTTLNSQIGYVIQNDTAADYNNTSFDTDEKVLYAQDATKKYVVNYPLWWVPVTDENGDMIKYPRQDRSEVASAGRNIFDGSLFPEKANFFWGDNRGVKGVESGSDDRIMFSTVDSVLSYTTDSIHNTFYRAGEQAGKELFATRRFSNVRQNSGFEYPAGTTLWNSFFNPQSVRYVVPDSAQAVASIQKQPDTVDKTRGLTSGYNIWTRANCGIALDIENKMAWWIIPDMLQYQDPQNLDMSVLVNRERALYSRIVLQPIVATKYTGPNNYTNTLRNAYDIIIDVFFGGEEPEEAKDDTFDDEDVPIPENKGGNGTYHRRQDVDVPGSNPALNFTLGNGFTNIYVMGSTKFPNESVKLLDYIQSYTAIRLHSYKDPLWRGLKAGIADAMQKGALRLYALPVGLGEEETSQPAAWFVGGFAVGINAMDNTGWQVYWNGDPRGESQARQVTASEYVFTVDISEAFSKFYDTFADYVPYTEAVIYLPYIGWRSIPLSNLYEFTNIVIVYRIAILTGAVSCRLNADGLTLETWTGNCAVDMPLVQTDITGLMGAAFSGVVKTIGKVGGAIIGGIGGGAGGAMLGSELGGAVGEIAGDVPGNGRGRVEVNTTNPSGLEGYMLPQNVSVTFHRANIIPPEKFAQQIGETLYATTNIRNLHGYTEIADVKLKCSATTEEKDEIVAMLKGGVVLP